MLQAIAGYDAKEVNSYDMPVEDYAAATTDGDGLRLRVGVPRDFFYAGLDPEVKEATEQAVAVLTELGAEVRETTVEVATDRTVILAEAYAYRRGKHREAS
jgi:aspartyl-tRNA(Asn)/glutamyl-tRNA(Gln) amidotransferase subunit A